MNSIVYKLFSAAGTVSGLPMSTKMASAAPLTFCLVMSARSMQSSTFSMSGSRSSSKIFHSWCSELTRR